MPCFRLKGLEVELYSLNRQVDSFRSARLLDKETISGRPSLPISGPKTTKQAAGGGLFICGGGGGRGSLKETPTVTNSVRSHILA